MNVGKWPFKIERTSAGGAAVSLGRVVNIEVAERWADDESAVAEAKEVAGMSADFIMAHTDDSDLLQRYEGGPVMTVGEAKAELRAILAFGE